MTDGYDFDQDVAWIVYLAVQGIPPVRGSDAYEEAARRFQTLRRKNEPGTQ